MPSKAWKRRGRRKLLRGLIASGARPCPPAAQNAVAPPPHCPDVPLYDWSGANHIDLGQLRKAIKSGRLLPDRKLDAIQVGVADGILEEGTSVDLFQLGWDTLLAARRAEIEQMGVALRLALSSAPPEVLAEFARRLYAALRAWLTGEPDRSGPGDD